MTEGAFDGLLFGPGLPGGGCRASGRWGEDGTLRLSLTGTEGREFVVASPAIGAGGFNAAGIRITWREEDGAFAFVIDSDGGRAACLASAPPHHAAQMSAAARTRSGVEQRFRLGWLAISMLLALPLLGIALFLARSDSIAGVVVRYIPHAQEARLGELVLAQTRLRMRLLDSGPAVEAIGAIGGRLTTGSPHRYRWFVADNPQMNAFAAPGGVVVVFSGLISSVASPEEIAGVLAHEVAHAELRHGLKAMVKGLGLRALVALLAGDVSGGVLADGATRLTELRFSRQAEHEADAEGLRRLVAARIDPRAMLRFYEKLAAKHKLAPPPLLSTHPATDERIERLRRELSGIRQGWEPLAVDLDAAKRGLP